ncbi:NAD-dependent epimerase/dehydratase family protein [Actinomadura harenae]|uniref:NAD-dependent epimerase/dehydratase family protein n=1 Tax=Actinomadura harenae TaxID=2483351 RepID=A0A3M2M0R8_9ACTN|nr:NAD-dependent epimerase/dehydratase family protein [Actinomadura harenae]RMI43177.1 NAD-dependent epimerase/dehydratase family protein [Actinomadura harenae]
MEIVGDGFLARHLKSIEGDHPGVVVAAAGVSAAGHTSEAEFSREATLVYDLVHRCAESGERLLFFSTASTGMYSVPGEPGVEAGPVFPATPYGRHKLALESVLTASGIDHLILRLGHVVGPDQPPHQLLPALTAQVAAGSVRVFSGARRDLIDVADVVGIISQLLDAGVSRTRVNVASGFAVPIERIVRHLERRLGTTAEWHYQRRTMDQPVSIAKLRRLVPAVTGMGFGPEYHVSVLDRFLASNSPDGLVPTTPTISP